MKLRPLIISAFAVFAAGLAIADIPHYYTPRSNDTVKVNVKGSYKDMVWLQAIDTSGPCSATRPAVSSGFGTNTAMVGTSAGCTYAVNTGAAAVNGVLVLPGALPDGTAITGWNCTAQDITTTNAAAQRTQQIASSANTATIEDFTNTGVAGNWTANDIVSGICSPYI